MAVVFHVQSLTSGGATWVLDCQTPKYTLPTWSKFDQLALSIHHQNSPKLARIVSSAKSRHFLEKLVIWRKASSACRFEPFAFLGQKFSTIYGGPFHLGNKSIDWPDTSTTCTTNTVLLNFPDLLWSSSLVMSMSHTTSPAHAATSVRQNMGIFRGHEGRERFGLGL